MKVTSCLVTTTRRADESGWQLARYLASQLGQEPRRRREGSLMQMCQEAGTQGALVCGGEKAVLWFPGGTFSYHPGMAPLRARGLRRGGRDRLAEAMALEPGNSVLDCTLGLGADAAVCSLVVGETGRVVGLESTLLLAVMVAHGLKTYQLPDGELQAAMRRVAVWPENYISCLPLLADNAFDVVYFDPMFRRGLPGAPSLRLLDPLLNKQPLDASSVREARRVARKRVVFKELCGSSEFSRLGFFRVMEDTSGRIAYGII